MKLPRLAPAPLISLSWLLRLRWGAVFGQLFTIAVTVLLIGVELPVPSLVAVVGAAALSNVLLWRRLRAAHPPSQLLAAGVLVLDVVLLTLLLALTGGPANPFATLYVVHVTLAVVVLGSSWGWAVMLLSTFCYALLFVAYRPLPGIDMLASPWWTLVLRGMWLSFIVAAAVIAYFVSRIQAELRARELELARIQQQVARDEKLASLTTLAAGAAHELGTPLATIAVVAKELERAARSLGTAAAFADDARLIREEVERCRGILVQMSAKAGENAGELPGPVPLEQLLSDLKKSLKAEQSQRLQLVREARLDEVVAPRQALVLVLSSLVRNAFDATESGAPVRLTVTRAGEAGERVRFAVHDEGPGMPAEVLRRACDPFFTTKAPGKGSGLGLFLARAFAERLGGRLTLSSTPGAGTTAAIELPTRPELPAGADLERSA